MKVVKEKSEFGLNVFLKEEGKYLAFTFGGNGDLYWSIHSRVDDKVHQFNHEFLIITKENYAIYSVFEQLFFDIENINISDLEDDDIPYYIETEEEKQEYIENHIKKNEEEKIKYRLYNHSNYNELFDDNTKTITWYSDETAHEVANILKIRKEANNFKIEFYIQPYIEGYDEDFHSLGYIPIRFRNSGSSYNPFNIIFMKMYNSLREIDDINDIGHQVHIEEYIYSKEQVKKLVKNQ